MLSRRFGLAFLIAVSLPLASRADMSEEDRKARCANNQARIEALQAKIKDDPYVMSDEELARARAEMLSLSNFIHDASALHGEALRRRISTVSDIALRYLGDSYPIYCGGTYPIESCAASARSHVAGAINNAVQAQPRLRALQQQIALSRMNLTALRCNVPAGPDANEAGSIASRFGMLRTRVSQEQYADAYGKLAVLLAGYGAQIGWKNAQDPSVPNDPGRGITDFTAHHDHVINHGGGDVAGSIANRVDELRQKLSPSNYAAMEREASQLLTSYGV